MSVQKFDGILDCISDALNNSQHKLTILVIGTLIIFMIVDSYLFPPPREVINEIREYTEEHDDDDEFHDIHFHGRV